MSLVLLSRRNYLAYTMAAVGMPYFNTAARASTEKTIDRQVRSEERKYGLTFAAENQSELSQLGHAFIIWQHEDDQKLMSVSEAIGFYPTGEPDGIDLILGSPGSLESDFGTAADIKLTVLLNSDLFSKALDAKHTWEQDGSYKVFWRNCTTHVSAIAQAIGLTTSSGTWESPQSFVGDLMANNN